MSSSRTWRVATGVAAAAAVLAVTGHAPATAPPAPAMVTNPVAAPATFSAAGVEGAHFVASTPHTHAHDHDGQDLFASAVPDSADDYSFLSSTTPPARWNPCDYVDWKATLDGAPLDGFNTLVEAVRRVEAATGLRFRYQGITDFQPTRAATTEPGVDLSVGWLDHTRTDLVVPRTGLGGGWYRSAVDAQGRRAHRMLSGFAVIESASHRENDTVLRTAPFQDDEARRAFTGRVLDVRLQFAMHEIGHAIGLGHALGMGQVMSPQARGVATWGPGDRVALGQVGASHGCLGDGPAPAQGAVPAPVAGPDLLPSQLTPAAPTPPAAPPAPVPAPAPAPAPAPPAWTPADGFRDVIGNAHAEAIRKVAAAGITSGYADGTFRPGERVTRAQMATFLTRALGLEPAPGSRFSDTAGSPHEAAINAVAAAGITLGDGRGGFAPQEAVTRAQMATFLTRALDLAPAAPGRFTDTAGSAHAASIDALAQAGISLGDGRGRFDPEAVVTRGQLATFLSRALQL